MSETHPSEIRPATDEEIADYRTWNLNWLHHPKLAVSTVVSGLLARIEADRAQNAELLAALERFADRRCRFDMPGLCAKVTNIEKCDRCHARAVIQKAKESR